MQASLRPKLSLDKQSVLPWLTKVYSQIRYVFYFKSGVQWNPAILNL